MKVIIVTHGNYLQFDRVAAGNSVRAYYFALGFAHYDVEVVHLYPACLGIEAPDNPVPAPGIRVAAYRDRQELNEFIRNEDPDLLFFGYWELLEDLDECSRIPVVLDVIAPRVLEMMYQDANAVPDEVRRMLTLYQKADRFIVGNERQKHFLVPWLIMAGFGTQAASVIDIIPISTDLGPYQKPILHPRSWTFVSGGVDWPWRRSEEYFTALVEEFRQDSDIQGKLLLLSGKYIYDNSKQQVATKATLPQEYVSSIELLPYGEMEMLLRDRCDIGLELAEQNIERYYSQSFRSIEYLRSGLPIICNDYLYIASLISHYDAGWVIHAPEDISAVLRSLKESPDEWEKKSANARRLIDERFNFRTTILPLIAYLQNPKKTAHNEPIFSWMYPAEEMAPECPNPSFSTDGSERSESARNQSRGNILSSVAIVTREDVFPPNHGAAVKIDRTAWGLSYHVPRVVLVTGDRSKYYVYENGKTQPKYYPIFLRFLGPSKKSVLSRLKRRGIPEADAFLYYPEYDWSYTLRTLYVALRYGVSFFQAEFPGYARACFLGRRVTGGKVIVIEHNIEYQRLKEQYPDMSASAYAFLRQVELDLCGQADAVVTVSERDRNALLNEGIPPGCVHYIPHGVDLDQFDKEHPVDVRGVIGVPPEKPLLVYHGTYLYPPNLEAVHVLTREILPRLHLMGIRPAVLAIGPHPPTEQVHEDVYFTGPVEKVAPWLMAADLAVVPLLSGGGTRMKILDYFAARLPVVSTSKGIEGIPVVNGVHARIEDDYDKFAEAIGDLLRNPEKAQALGASGRAYAESLDWRTIAERYLRLFEAT